MKTALAVGGTRIATHRVMLKRNTKKTTDPRRPDRLALRQVRGGAMTTHLSLEANGTTIAAEDDCSK